MVSGTYPIFSPREFVPLLGKHEHHLGGHLSGPKIVYEDQSGNAFDSGYLESPTKRREIGRSDRRLSPPPRQCSASSGVKNLLPLPHLLGHQTFLSRSKHLLSRWQEEEGHDGEEEEPGMTCGKRFFWELKLYVM